tara:strand:+ start:181 stop:444 length:264 start_codon:yes stop_codon:yes gene_type:complete
MALENLVIHSITGGTFNLDLYEYHQVMFGGAATADLNGTTVTVSGPITINLRLRSASHTSGADVYALGYRAAVEPLEQHFLNGGFRP